MVIEFPDSNKVFNDLKAAENHLAFEHFPVVIVVNDKRGTFDSFTSAMSFIKENINF